jgi:hypothetical protein
MWEDALQTISEHICSVSSAGTTTRLGNWPTFYLQHRTRDPDRGLGIKAVGENKRR